MGTREYRPILELGYGPLDPKVDLKPDFLEGFTAARRKEITEREAGFYHGITEPYSVDGRIDKRLVPFRSYDGHYVTMKVYRPRGSEGERLVPLMFLHGGAFITCSLETHDFVPSYLCANAHVMCFSVDYRLAPEARFPVGLEDSYAACRWVAENADELGVDPARMVVCGDSSGGNFAAVLSLMARDRGDLHIDGQVLIYPVTDLENLVGSKRSPTAYAPVGGAGAEGYSWMTREYLADPDRDVRNPYFSPLLADDLSHLPRALVISAECDPLADDGLFYAAALQDTGNPVEVRVYEGMPHAFILRTYDETFEALDAICGFVR